MDRKLALTVVGTSVVSTTIGWFASKHLVEKKITASVGAEFDARMEEELDKIRGEYAAVHKPQYPTPKDAVRDLIGEEASEEEVATTSQFPPASELVPDSVKKNVNYSGLPPLKPTEGEKVTEVSVKVDGDEVTQVEVVEKSNTLVNGVPIDPSEWVDDRDLRDWKSGAPNMISEDEYNKNDSDFDQITLTYFKEDQTLVDENDQIIEDTDTVVGDNNLRKFHLNSGANRTVMFVRNDTMSADYMILASGNSYARGVLGEIRHAETPHRLMRFRGEQE